MSRLRRRRAASRTFVNKTLEKIDQKLQDYTDDKLKEAKLKAFRDTLNEKLGVLTELNEIILDQLDIYEQGLLNIPRKFPMLL